MQKKSHALMAVAFFRFLDMRPGDGDAGPRTGSASGPRRWGSWASGIAGRAGQRRSPDTMHEMSRTRSDRKLGRKLETRVGRTVRHHGQFIQRSARRDRGIPGQELSTATETSTRGCSWSDECVFQGMERSNTRFSPS